MFGLGKKRDSSSELIYQEAKKEALLKIQAEKDSVKLESIKADALKDAKRESMTAFEKLRDTRETAAVKMKKVTGTIGQFGANFKANTAKFEQQPASGGLGLGVRSEKFESPLGGALGAEISKARGQSLAPKAPERKGRRIVIYD